MGKELLEFAQGRLLLIEKVSWGARWCPEMGFSEASLPTIAGSGFVPGPDLHYMTFCRAQVVLDIPDEHFLKN